MSGVTVGVKRDYENTSEGKIRKTKIRPTYQLTLSECRKPKLVPSCIELAKLDIAPKVLEIVLTKNKTLAESLQWFCEEFYGKNLLVIFLNLLNFEHHHLGDEFGVKLIRGIEEYAPIE